MPTGEMPSRSALPLLLLAALAAAFVRAIPLRQRPRRAPGARAVTTAAPPAPARARGAARHAGARRSRRPARPRGLGDRAASGAAPRAPERHAWRTRGPRTEFGSTRVMSVAAAAAPGSASSPPRSRTAGSRWVHTKNPGLRLRRPRLLPARRPVRAPARVAQRRPRVRRISRRDRPPRLGDADRPLRGHGQAARLALRPLLRLLHPRPERPPAEPAGRLAGGNRLAIHGTDAPGTIGTPASAGCLRAADATSSLMRRVPLGTPVFINN